MPERDQVQQYVGSLAELAEEIIVYVGGHLAQFQEILFPANIIRISSLADFIQHINQIKAR
jgi:hypothetical protein